MLDVERRVSIRAQGGPVGARLRQFAEQLGNRRLWFGLLLTVILVAGHFSAFTFVRPLLLSASGIGSEWIGGLLFAYGVAGIAGNFLIGISAAQRTEASLMAIAAQANIDPAARPQTAAG